MSPDYQTFCHCQKCRIDITALSLNNLPSYCLFGYNKTFLQPYSVKRIVSFVTEVNKLVFYNNTVIVMKRCEAIII